MSNAHSATLLAAALVVATPHGVRAHDPAAGLSLVFEGDATEPSAVVTNRGLLFGGDEGDVVTGSSLRCSQAYGATTAHTPSVYMDSGALLIGMFDGVQRTDDRACSFEVLGEGLPNRSLSPMVRVSDGYLISSRTLAEAAPVFESSDGVTWTERYVAEADSYLDTLIVAPGDASVVVAGGVARGETTTVKSCALSDDAGASWTVKTLDRPITPFAIDPADASIIYAYEPMDAAELFFRVLRTSDGCETFETLIEDVHQPVTVTGPADSGVRYLGTEASNAGGGLFRSSALGEPFERVLSDEVLSVTCLEQHDDRLWICATRAPNVNGIWYSDDDLASVESWLRMPEVQVPVSCDAAEANALCAGHWYDFYSELHPAGADAGAGGTDAGVADAGDTDASVTPTEDAAVDAGSDGGDSTADASETSGGGSGGCQSASQGAQGLLWTLLLTALALVSRSVGRARTRA